MVLPSFQDFYLLCLKSYQDGKKHTNKETKIFINNYLKLTDEDKVGRISDGTLQWVKRSEWSMTYLRNANLIKSMGRGCNKITDEGLKVLKQKPEKIDNNFLLQYESFREFKNKSNKKSDTKEIIVDNEVTYSPEEIMQQEFKLINDSLAEELYNAIMNNSPYFFENLVVDLLINMGYGIDEQSGHATVKTGDEGIDGIINEDKLGLSKIYIQAKQYDRDNPVGSKPIREFIGFLDGNKGVFITTSSFTKPAIKAAKNPSSKNIILIDGKKLTELMVEYGVGV